jgi:transposase
VAALQTMRGMALVNAATLIAELGDLSRFADPRQLMAYLGLVPSEHSSGASVKRGGITKAGNGAARRLLIEAAWSYRFPARLSRELLLRQENQPRPIRDIAWRGQVRLCARYRRLARTGKPANVVTTAIARELSGFVWANHPTRSFRARLGARSRSGEPSHPLSAGSPIRRRLLDRGSSATHQRSCGSDPRIRV